MVKQSTPTRPARTRLILALALAVGAVVPLALVARSDGAVSPARVDAAALRLTLIERDLASDLTDPASTPADRVHRVESLHVAIGELKERLVEAFGDHARDFDQELQACRDAVREYATALSSSDSEGALTAAVRSFPVARFAARIQADSSTRIAEAHYHQRQAVAILRAYVTVLLLGLSYIVLAQRSRSAETVASDADEDEPPLEPSDETLGEATNAAASELEEELAATRAELALLQRSHNRLTDFVGDAFQAPLLSIKSGIQSLAPLGFTQSQRTSLLSGLHRHCEDLYDSLENILDANRLRRGAYEPQRVRTPLIDLVESVQASLRPCAHAKDILFDVTFNGEIPEIVETDPNRLRRVLKAVCQFAVHRTTHGGIEFALRGDTQAGELTLSVIDSAPYLTPEQIELHFSTEHSETAENSAHEDLPIVHSLVQSLGGSLSVSSTAGQGSTVEITIPTGIAEVVVVSSAPEPVPTEHRTRAQYRILIADDVFENRRLVEFMIRKDGIAGVFVENGRQAVDTALDAWRAGEPFDLILMDMSMPILDGYEATRTLRDAGYERPILAFTAHAMPDDRDKCLAAGCDDYLMKPIGANGFLEALRKHLQSTDQMNYNDMAPQVDEGEFVSELAGDADMVELIEMFVDDLREDTERIRTALEAGDFTRVASLAHQLKGSAGGYGYPQITKAAQRVEACIRDQRDAEVLEAETRAFIEMCTRVRI